MTPRGTILAETASVVSGLGAKIYTSFADVLAATAELSLVIGPGAEEALEAERHDGGSTRRYPLRVICTAWTREAADALAFEVEAAMQYELDADRIGARLTGCNFTESSDKSERVYFSTIVNFDVLYEAAAPA